MAKDPLVATIGKLLASRGWHLAVAESCTGGLLADHITDMPGSSQYFIGGFVAYAYEAKVNLLGVKWPILEKYGAVSEEVVLQMAHGARRALHADIAISISGIAGPGGATPDKPIGLTWIGLCTPDHEEARRFIWQGDRRSNKAQSAQAALKLLAEYLES